MKRTSKLLATSFDYNGTYQCPVCRVGKISHMPLMEAMSCDFCQQIFTIDVDQQQLKMPSRQPPLIWRWNGFSWTEAQLEGVEFGWGYAVAAIAFIILPTLVIGVVAYNFPPNPAVPLSWLPYIWTGMTFMSHLTIILWLIVEIYQIPLRAYARAVREHLTWW